MLSALAALAGLGLLYGLACLAVWLGMRRPPAVFAAIAARIPTGVLFALFPVEIMWKSARAGRLRAGDLAPDFRLRSPDWTYEVTLSSHRGVRPVLLVFGSYT